MPEPDKFPYKRDADFESLYANNIQFESSLWDLKLIFGQLDQAEACTNQHTAIALPWAHVKVASYYLLINLIFHQMRNGPIALPSDVMPPRPNPSDAEVSESDKPMVEYFAWIHDQIFGVNPYVPPSVQAAQKPPTGQEG